MLARNQHSFFRSLQSYGTVPANEAKANELLQTVETQRLQTIIEMLKTKQKAAEIVRWMKKHRVVTFFFMMLVLSGVSISINWKSLSRLHSILTQDITHLETLREIYNNAECPNDWYHPEYTQVRYVRAANFVSAVYRYFLKIDDYCVADLPHELAELVNHLRPEICLKMFNNICSAISDIQKDSSESGRYYFILGILTMLAAFIAICLVQYACQIKSELHSDDVTELTDVGIDPMMTPERRIATGQAEMDCREFEEVYRREVNVTQDLLNEQLKVGGDSKTGLCLPILEYADLPPLAYNVWLAKKYKRELPHDEVNDLEHTTESPANRYAP